MPNALSTKLVDTTSSTRSTEKECNKQLSNGSSTKQTFLDQFWTGIDPINTGQWPLRTGRPVRLLNEQFSELGQFVLQWLSNSHRTVTFKSCSVRSVLFRSIVGSVPDQLDTVLWDGRAKTNRANYQHTESSIRIQSFTTICQIVPLPTKR